MNCPHGNMGAEIESSWYKDLDKYVDALYAIFKRDFIDHQIIFDGKNVDIIHEKYYQEKERSFWHLISEGEHDADRTPVSFRAGKIPWARKLIEENGDCDEHKIWKKLNVKNNKTRIYIWCETINYMVILEDRGEWIKLITAYPVQKYNVKRYQKEFLKYKE